MVMTKFAPSQMRDDETHTSFIIRCIREETLHNLLVQVRAMDVSGASSGYFGDDFGAYVSGLESSKDEVIELLNAAIAKA
jgi:hypothetical protein